MRSTSLNEAWRLLQRPLLVVLMALHLLHWPVPPVRTVALLVSPSEVSKRPTSVVHDLIRTHDQVVQACLHLHAGLSLVHVPDLALLVARADVLLEETRVDGVHDLQGCTVVKTE